jgi:hypothetical protein
LFADPTLFCSSVEVTPAVFGLTHISIVKLPVKLRDEECGTAIYSLAPFIFAARCQNICASEISTVTMNISTQRTV